MAGADLAAMPALIWGKGVDADLRWHDGKAPPGQRAAGAGVIRQRATGGAQPGHDTGAGDQFQRLR